MGQGNRQTDSVAKAIGLEILSGKHAHGDALPADTVLCERFGVSRTVIREALRLLGGKGLLAARPRIGTLVAPRAQWALWDSDILLWLSEIDEIGDFLRDGHDMRLAIEPMLAALAASRGNGDTNSALQQALRDLQSSTTPEHEIAFLAAFYRCSNNQLAIAALPLTAFCLKKRSGTVPLEQYRKLTAAIAQKDAATARQITFQYLLEQ